MCYFIIPGHFEAAQKTVFIFKDEMTECSKAACWFLMWKTLDIAVLKRTYYVYFYFLQIYSYNGECLC